MAKYILGRKQSITNDNWAVAIEQIEELVSKEEIDLLEAITVEEIRKNTQDKHTAYAWSGGKDSIVLEALCQKAGVTECMIGLTQMEYPAFEDWIEQNQPKGLNIVRTKHDLEWLEKNIEALFPPMTYHWSRYVQIATQEKYYREAELDMMLLGRRKADGNYVGKGTNLYTDGKKRTKFNPMSDWKHEHVLAYIHYHGLPIPPCYQWENGYKIGTHPWFVRPYIDRDYQKGWGQIEAIDPDIVKEASTHIESAKIYLGG